MFTDRVDAALQLAARLRGRSLTRPLVLAIPRGGVVLGAILARELGADLDVVLSRKLRAPHQPELAIGAICENGDVYVNPEAATLSDLTNEYIELERQRELQEIRSRRRMIASVRPPANIADRSVVVTDDGIATGSTMIAALRMVRLSRPRELIVAVPVAAPDRLAEVATWCDEVVCLHAPADFVAIGQFYDQFDQVDDARMLRTLAGAGATPP